jgi:hypothetical protein
LQELVHQWEDGLVEHEEGVEARFWGIGGYLGTEQDSLEMCEGAVAHVAVTVGGLAGEGGEEGHPERTPRLNGFEVGRLKGHGVQDGSPSSRGSEERPMMSGIDFFSSESSSTAFSPRASTGSLYIQILEPADSCKSGELTSEVGTAGRVSGRAGARDRQLYRRERRIRPK